MTVDTLTDNSRASVFTGLLAESRAAATVDVEGLADAEVLESLTELCEAASAVNVTLARVIAHADRHDLTVADCGLKVAGWLARHTHRPAGQCRKQVSRARSALQHFPVAVEAAADGLLGWDHVDLLVAVSNSRNREALASVQHELIEAAQEMSWRQWETLLRRVAEQADEDGAYDPNEDEHANRLRLNTAGDGTIDISGRLVGECAHIVDSTIDAIADELFRNYSRDHDLDADCVIPDRVTLKALAFAEACRRARAIDLNTTAPSRPEAIIIIEADNTTNHTTITNRYGHTIPDAAIRTLLADAEYRALTIDGARNPLNLGDKHRFASPEQRIALTVRDGGCIFPGCEMPAPWCDAHHIIGYEHGGPTDLENLGLLCRQHHRLSHTNGWHMQQTPNPTQTNSALFQWTTPTGQILHSEHRSGTPPGRR